MAIQIWDAQAGQYKSADLARFGGSGTLTEALVWDGTQYVKVWPSSAYPVSGTWSGTVPAMPSNATLASHTLTEAGTFTVSATVTADVTHAVFAIRDGDLDDVLFEEFGEGAVTGSATAALAAGTRLDFITYGMPAGPGTGAWSIIKN